MKGLSYIAMLVALMLLSCVREPDTVSVFVDPDGWRPEDARTVSYVNKDTLALSEVSLFLTHSRTFGGDMDSLILTVTTVTPDSTVFSENITIHPNPAFISSATLWHETVYPYRSHARLSQAGEYKFLFSHSQTLPVRGVKAIGLIIKPEDR